MKSRNCQNFGLMGPYGVDALLRRDTALHAPCTAQESGGLTVGTGTGTLKAGFSGKVEESK